MAVPLARAAITHQPLQRPVLSLGFDFRTVLESPPILHPDKSRS